MLRSISAKTRMGQIWTLYKCSGRVVKSRHQGVLHCTAHPTFPYILGRSLVTLQVQKFTTIRLVRLYRYFSVPDLQITMTVLGTMYNKNRYSPAECLLAVAAAAESPSYPSVSAPFLHFPASKFEDHFVVFLCSSLTFPLGFWVVHSLPEAKK